MNLKNLSRIGLDLCVVAAAWWLFFSSTQGLALAGWLAGSYCIWRVLVTVYHGLHMSKSGYLAPAPTLPARLFYSFATWLLAKLAIGPIKVTGRENLPKKGRVILVPNHTYPPDFAVVARSTGKSCRFMTLTGELQGLRGIFGAWTGAIPVNPKVPGGGQAAVDASVEALAESSGACLLIFPQGRLVTDNVLKREDFKNGFARIGAAVRERIGDEPVYVVPMALHYKRSEEDKKPLGWLLSRTRKMFGQGRQYGANAVIGTPIEIRDLPADPDKACDVVFERISTLLPLAQKGQAQ